MTNYRVNLSQAMNVVPKDFKLMLKVKSPGMTSLPAVTTCAFRKAFSPEKVRQLRSAWSLTFEDAGDSAEKSEL